MISHFKYKAMSTKPQFKVTKMKTGNIQTVSSKAKTIISDNLRQKAVQTKDITLLHEGVYVEYLALNGTRPLYKVLKWVRDPFGIYDKINVQKVKPDGTLDTQRFDTTMDKLHVLWIQPGDYISYREINKRTKSEDIFMGTVTKIWYDTELNIRCHNPSDGTYRDFMSMQFSHIDILGSKE